MRLQSVPAFGACVRVIALLLATLATLGYGCGSAEQKEVSATPGGSKLLGEEGRYRYEGTGANKKKIELSPKERRKAVGELKRKEEGH
jgi:hypothetical protein